jgi:hypothetical protein
MTVQDILDVYGTGYNFEKATGLSHVNIINWLRKGYIPLESQWRVQERSKGALKVKFEDLGPR